MLFTSTLPHFKHQEGYEVYFASVHSVREVHAMIPALSHARTDCVDAALSLSQLSFFIQTLPLSA